MKSLLLRYLYVAIMAYKRSGGAASARRSKTCGASAPSIFGWSHGSIICTLPSPTSFDAANHLDLVETKFDPAGPLLKFLRPKFTRPRVNFGRYRPPGSGRWNPVAWNADGVVPAT